ncbi:hypothetical protein GGR53DRAFT_371330 [Hypoxylon sp. FL1150]|nr:hypothetical protein GGR53DRAFT_371330 [Hypoxylon sp. FL1150]
MDPSMFINNKVVVKQCADVSKGLGVFATRNLSKGLRLYAENPLLRYESTFDAMEDIERSFEYFSFFNQAGFTRLFAGTLDVTPFIKTICQWSDRDVARVPGRLRQIVRFNSVEGQGTGCLLTIYSSFLNHSCVPNAFLYWNDMRNTVTVHAIRNISKGEEVTISYFQEAVYLNTLQRNARLAN